MTIKNESAYNAAIQRRIQFNASITRSKKWEAENADARRLSDLMHMAGEFDYQCSHCNCSWGAHLIGDDYSADAPTDKCRQTVHPVVASAHYGTGGEILKKMRDALSQWGSLTPKQTEMVRNMLARAEARVAQRKAEREAKRAIDAARSHVGTVGERRVFDLTIERVLSFDSQFGTTYINLCRDADGNVVVYKGSNDLSRGEYEKVSTVRVKATVKAHELRDGIPQTIIARPKEVAA